MKLANRDIQRLYAGLKKIDEDAETKLDGDIRLRIAVNLNRLLNHVRAVDQTVQRLNNETIVVTNVKNGERVDMEKLNDLQDQIEKVLLEAEDIKLKKFKIADFKLQENKKIRGDTVAQIGRLVSDFDDGASDEDE